MTQPESQSPFLTVPQLAVLALGAVLFVLLLLADKSNLSRQPDLPEQPETETGTNDSGRPAEVTASMLPILEGGTDTELINRLATADAAKKHQIQDSLVALYLSNGRPDLAFVYSDPHTDSERIQAGRMALAALQIPAVFNDTALSGKFARNAAWQFSQILSADSLNEDALMGYGISLINSGGAPTNSMKGIQALVKVTKINPNNVDAFMQLGLFSLETGQFDKARERFEHILSLRPGQDTAMYYLANAEFELGNINRSEELLQQVIQQSDNPDLVKNAKENLKSLPKK